MAHNNNQSFWDFIQSFDPNHPQGHGPGAATGAGVDHAPPPFGPGAWNPEAFRPWGGRGGWGHFGGPWGGPGHDHGPPGHGHGRHGRRHHREGHDTDREENPPEHDRSDKEDSPETMRDSPEGPAGPDGSHPPPPPPPPPFGGPHHPPHPPHPPHWHGRRPFGGRGHHGPATGPGPCGPGSPRRRGGRCGRRDHGPPPMYSGPFDFRPLMHAFASHPFAQAFNNASAEGPANARSAAQAGQAEENEGEEDNTFTPPIDVFNTEKAYILHIALPGAVKEDVGVNWDPDQGVLNVAGVVYRPGNEEFLQSLTSSERRVGMFERTISLPPAGSDEKEEVDGFGISAKMENGILIVTVPKAEKEWTEIHKIDVD